MTTQYQQQQPIINGGNAHAFPTSNTIFQEDPDAIDPRDIGPLQNSTVPLQDSRVPPQDSTVHEPHRQRRPSWEAFFPKTPLYTKAEPDIIHQDIERRYSDSKEGRRNSALLAEQGNSSNANTAFTQNHVSENKAPLEHSTDNSKAYAPMPLSGAPADMGQDESSKNKRRMSWDSFLPQTPIYTKADPKIIREDRRRSSISTSSNPSRKSSYSDTGREERRTSNPSRKSSYSDAGGEERRTSNPSSRRNSSWGALFPQSQVMVQATPDTVIHQRRLSADQERRKSETMETEQQHKSEVANDKMFVVDNFDSLKAGKLPTNSQLDRVVNRLLASRVIEYNKSYMSTDGQLLLKDFQELLLTLQGALKTKNKDELFQSMVYHIKKSEIPIDGPSDKTTNQVQDEVKTGAHAITKIAKLLLFNSQFRNILDEILVLAQHAIGNAMAEGGKKIQDNATNDSSDGRKSESMLNKARSKEAVRANASDAAHAMKDQLNSSVSKSANTQAQTDDGAVIHEAIQKQQDDGNDDDNDNSSTVIIEKLKTIFVSIQKNQEYQNAVSTLMTIFSVWGKRLASSSNNVSLPSSGNAQTEIINGRRRSSTEGFTPEQYLSRAAQEGKTIIEDWAQGRSLDPVIDAVNDLTNKIKEDNELSQFMDTVKTYFKKLLKEPGYLESKQSTNDGKELIDRSREKTFDKYRPEINGLIDESNGIVKAINNDPTTKDISNKIKDIHNHLWYDSNGKISFKPQLLNDIRTTLVPAVIEQIKYVPLPQIIYTDKQLEIALENMVLLGDSLMPEVFEIKADDYIRFSPLRSDFGYANSQGISIHLSGIQTYMEDVIFYYKRLTGFPRLSDNGVVNFQTGGKGIRIYLKISSNSLDPYHTFRVDQCRCYIDKLKVQVKSSKHNILYKVMNPVMTSIIKRQLAKTIERKVTGFIQESDTKVTKQMGSQQNDSPGSGRKSEPGVFSHFVNMMSEKVSAI